MASLQNQSASDAEYDSDADEDFHPETTEAHQAYESFPSDDDDVKANTSRVSGTDNALDFDNSGDEATITKARRKRRKLSGTAARVEDDSSDVIKTRAQRKLEQHEKKERISQGPTSVNVDALWAMMSGPPTNTTGLNSETPHDNQSMDSGPSPSMDSKSIFSAPNGQAHIEQRTPGATTSTREPMVTIKRKIEFAGQVTEEERQVPASSAEAKLYLENQRKESPSAPLRPTHHRPKKRKSMFDQPQVDKPADDGKKLSTLEKSKLDWAAQVDKEGLADELEESSRGKADYLGRIDFLGRMDARKEANARDGGAG
ncbi:MAG: hypothetical protein Q9162_005093 [Coniocarpon cinnabarinum]